MKLRVVFICKASVSLNCHIYKCFPSRAFNLGLLYKSLSVCLKLVLNMCCWFHQHEKCVEPSIVIKLTFGCILTFYITIVDLGMSDSIILYYYYYYWREIPINGRR